MTGPLTPEAVARRFHDACLAELEALKPGNVHRYGDGHRMHVADFEASAAAAAASIGATGLSVGERIEGAVAATKDAVGQNTNLGIILLSAPLAQAALAPGAGDLRDRLTVVLKGLSVEDARAAYRAIRIAAPGGLGEAPAHDVANEPDISLIEAMRAAETRDRIAWNYTHGFVDIFDLGLKWLEGATKRWGPVPWTATYVYLGFLAHIPDSLIERKFGGKAAGDVRDEARPIEAGLSQCSAPEQMAAPLAAFDRSLKDRGLNPGTSADLTVATLFAAALQAP
ncbi:MAG: triphosphoribosyl-dephospho-CoA synthase [Methyloceanibacter sp.]|uniref:triphosphoribosyl-dephospho-CoA synthase n=1 Tax=Methyloceanibacter sp. TaxID=1965321 RepID=UPI003D6D1DEB